MLQKIGGGCSLQGYGSSTRDGVEIGGVVADKFASLFHIASKNHTVCFNKNHFHAVKALGLINLMNLIVSITHFTIGTILIIMIYRMNILFALLRSEFRIRLTSSYYVNVRNLGDINMYSIPSNCK